MITIAIVTALIAAVAALFRRLLFYLERGLCWIVGFLNDVFEMVSGLRRVTYTGDGAMESKLLINVFFGNNLIQTIYWGMALIGIVMCVGFTIAAVIKKSGDIDDKMKQSMGGILRNAFKSIVLILLMNFIVSATVTVTSTLMDRINYLFLNAQNFNFDYTITFDDEDYAAMARSLNSIGNYSLNASYNSRYNLNACYNKIRPELETLAEKGKFETTYITTEYDENGELVEKNTWQSVLQKIYRSVDDISVEQPLDEYNQKLSEAILYAMDVLNNDASFEALENYKVHVDNQTFGEAVPLDRLVMLIGSMYGTGDALYKGSGLTDSLRGPYYYGQKDIFDYDTVEADFDLSLGSWNHLTVIIVAIFFIKEMLTMVFNATARIFNMLLLYISAPPFFAVTPLDDGGKMKQWTTAFIVQSLSLFGTLISLKLVTLFIPMIFSGNIVFFSGSKLDFFTRVIILLGTLFTARKASGMIVGILADNAGMQAIHAGDVGSEARNGVSRAGHSIGRVAMGLGGLAWGATKWAGGKELKKEFGSDSSTPSGGAQPSDGGGHATLPEPNRNMGDRHTNPEPNRNTGTNTTVPEPNRNMGEKPINPEPDRNTGTNPTVPEPDRNKGTNPTPPPNQNGLGNEPHVPLNTIPENQGSGLNGEIKDPGEPKVSGTVPENKNKEFEPSERPTLEKADTRKRSGSVSMKPLPKSARSDFSSDNK